MSEEEIYDKDLMRIYAKTINKSLCDDIDTKNKIPINPESEDDIFAKLKDGIVLAKLEALIDKEILTIYDFEIENDVNDINKNINNVLEEAYKLGFKLEINPDEILKEDKSKIQNLVKFILGKIMCSSHSIKNNPDIDDLIRDNENKNDIANGPINEFLKRWVNKHIKAAGYQNYFYNFDNDLKNGEVYIFLLNNLFPEYCDKSPLNENDINERMKKILNNCKNIGLDTAITYQDLVRRKESIGLLFISEIYNLYTNPYNHSEKESYCKIINSLLETDKELKNKLPIEPESNELFKKIKDGIILTKLINMAAPETIDERILVNVPGMTLDDKKFNLNLVINSAKSLGCITEITSDDILNEVRKKDIDLLYEIIELIIFKKISVKEYPQMLRFKEEKEDNEDILKLSQEDLIKRWINYLLSKNNYHLKLENFSQDLKNSEIYLLLINILNSQFDKNVSTQNDLLQRAEKVIEYASKLGTKVFIKSKDIISGNENLNKLFIAELFMAIHGLGEATNEEKMALNKLLDATDEIIREEIILRNWINSLKLEGVKKINNLFQDCRDGIILLELIDTMNPGNVNWKLVEFTNLKNPSKVGRNCQVVIDSIKRCGYKIVNIRNKDIQDGNKVMIIYLVNKLMIQYILKKIGVNSLEDLIKWANIKIPTEKQIKIDSNKIKLNDELTWLDLINYIEPKCIRWDLIVKNNPSIKDKEMNSKYILSLSRGLGALNFVSWKDITENQNELSWSFLASLYELSNSNKEQKKNYKIIKLKSEENKQELIGDKNIILENKELKKKIDSCQLENKKLKEEIDKLKSCESENKKLKDELINLQLIESDNKKLKEEIEKIKEENNNLKNDLQKANKIILTLSNQPKVENQSINNDEINNLKQEIKLKNDIINNLKKELENEKNKMTNINVNFNDIIVINFISTDNVINNKGIKCLKTDIFAEVEEKLYQEFPEYRETNNTFLANGQPVLRFKKIYENKIKDGDKIQLITYE